MFEILFLVFDAVVWYGFLNKQMSWMYLYALGTGHIGVLLIPVRKLGTEKRNLCPSSARAFEVHPVVRLPYVDNGNFENHT